MNKSKKQQIFKFNNYNNQKIKQYKKILNNRNKKKSLNNTKKLFFGNKKQLVYMITYNKKHKIKIFNNNNSLMI